MSTRGQFNTKNPTIKRILKEASELATNPSSDLYAAPLESNLFEWHFTLRGPPSPSPFSAGIYHGRILLPNAYPHRPPSFRFLTPSGRFEVNREICLSMSNFHEETWQPAWGIRTALVAIRSFMDTGAKGQIGGLETDEETRKGFAERSRSWRCGGGCSEGKTNEEILRDREEEVKRLEAEDGGGAKAKEEEKVPEELRLAYREDLGGEKTETTAAATAITKGKEKAAEEASQTTSQPSTSTTSKSPTPSTLTQRTTPQPTRTIPSSQPPTQHQQRGTPPTTSIDDHISQLLDKAIYAILGLLIFLLLRKFI